MKNWFVQLYLEAKFCQGAQQGWDCNDEGEMYRVEPEPFFVCLLRETGVQIAAFWWANIQHCDHTGTYHSEDWAGPDSGGMGGYCTRCGFSFHHPMY